MPYRRTVATAVLALGAAVPAAAQRPVSLVRPPAVVRVVAADSEPSVTLAYRAPEPAAPLALEVLDARGRSLIAWGGRDGAPLPIAPLDSVAWNMRYPGVTGADSAEWIPGPLVPPGRYLVRLHAGAARDSATLVVLPAPNAAATRMDYGEQLAFLLRVRDRLGEATAALRASRALRAEVDGRRDQMPDSLRARFDVIVTELARQVGAVESELRRADGTGVSDRLATLLTEAGAVDGHPSDEQYSTFMQQQIRLDIAELRMKGTLGHLLPFVNAALAQGGLAPVTPRSASALASR